MVLRAGLSLVLFYLVGCATGQNQGELPAVARPRFIVGAARSFDLGELSQAREIEFQLGSTQRRVAVASRFYTEPFARFTPGGKTADRTEQPVVSGQQPAAISARTTKRGPREGQTRLEKARETSIELLVEIEYPESGAIVGGVAGAFVTGRALAVLGEFRRFDVLLVLDTSWSTVVMTGADINGNGIIGQGGLRGLVRPTDPGDSILAAEVAAARRMLRGLDARSTRVGLVTFAGEPPKQGGLFSRKPREAALTEEPLTSDYARIERALDDVLERGPHGMTNMAAGLGLARVELTGLEGGLSEPHRESEKVILFFTDGQPTLPHKRFFEARNVKAVLRAADRARQMKVRIHSFAIGPEALDGPVAAVEMASRTGGDFTPVRDPADLVKVIETVSFANIDQVAIENLTTGAPASGVITNADGTFSALVPLEEGHNRVRAVARASDGSEASAEITLDYAPGLDTILPPPELMGRRSRLLERWLAELKRGRITAEQERVDAARKELLREIGRERSKAQERAAQQRKELKLEVEPTLEP